MFYPALGKQFRSRASLSVPSASTEDFSLAFKIMFSYLPAWEGEGTEQEVRLREILISQG